MAEHAAAYDEVARAVQLEQKELAGPKGAELRATAGLPEIDLLSWRPATQELEPLTVRQTDVELQHEERAPTLDIRGQK